MIYSNYPNLILITSLINMTLRIDQVESKQTKNSTLKSKS